MNRKTKRPLGRILMDGGFMSAKELNLAVLKQAQAGEPLDQALVKLGILDAAELSAVLSIQDDLSRPETGVKLASFSHAAPGILVDGGQQNDIGGTAFPMTAGFCS